MTIASTIAIPTIEAPSQPRRVWNVVRLHFVNRMIYLGIPWIIVGATWIVSMVIGILIVANSTGTGRAKAFEGMGNSWAVLSPLWYLVVVGVLAIAQSFPFALGLSVTRRDFYLGTALTFVVIGSGNALAFAVLTEIERATSGWGIGTRMFTALWFGSQPFLVNLLSYLVICLGVFFIGSCIATIYMRWRVVGMLVFWLGLVAALVIVGVVVTLANGWATLFESLVSLGVAGIFGWLAVLVAAAAVFGYLILRRATPKN